MAGQPSGLLTEFGGLDAFDNAVTTGLDFEPPDQGLCVGNGFVLESINVTIRAFDVSGRSRSSATDLNRFYGLPPLLDPATDRWGPVLTDPSCIYDPETKRFFHLVLTLEQDPVSGELTGPNFLDIAVSRTKDPTGRWDLFRIDTTNDGSNGTVDHDCPGELPDTTGPCLGDYPHLGLDANGFFVTTNEYALFDPDERFMGAQLYAMSKSALVEAPANVSFEMFSSLQVPERSQVGFTVRAANVPGTAWSELKHGTVFFASGMVGIESGNPSPDYDAITLWALSNTSSLDSPDPELKLRHRVVNTLPYQIPPPSTQRPGDLPLGECLNMEPCLSAFGSPPSPQGLSVVDSLDGRMLGTWFADGDLWFSLGTAVEVGGEDRAGILYGAIEPSFKHGKLRGRVQVQQYRRGGGQQPDHALGRRRCERARLSRLHVGRPRPLPERGRGEGLARPPGLEGEGRGGGPRPPGRVQRVLDRRSETEVGRLLLRRGRRAGQRLGGRRVHRSDVHVRRVDRRGPQLRRHPGSLRELRDQDHGAQVGRNGTRPGTSASCLGPVR